jgi:hypothetical protein
VNCYKYVDETSVSIKGAEISYTNEQLFASQEEPCSWVLDIMERSGV